MPSPMPSMLTTLTEKMDTSPSRVAATRTARVGMTPPSATSSGMPPATRPAEQQHHDDDGDGQRDGFAAQQVGLGRGLERLADQDVAADEDLGRVELCGQLLDLVGDGELGVLGEVAGEGDDEQGGPAVGGAQRGAGGPAGPGVGDVEDTVDGARCGPGRRVMVGLDLRVGDVDAVGDDGELPAGPVEVVELVGDPAGLGGAPGAEVGREDGERGAADDGGADQRRRPRPG